MRNLINKFWEGKIKLWKSYWLIGELLNALVILIIFNIEINIYNNKPVEGIIPFLSFNNFNFFNRIILAIWTLFITIGIWRSAESYKGPLIWILITLILLSYRVFAIRIIFF